MIVRNAFTTPRVSLLAVSPGDIVIQRMSCVNSRAGDVFVLISHSWRIKNMVELARLARVNGSTIIVITPHDLFRLMKQLLYA
ncbi:SIS domain-containing protein [Pantoea sp. NSTU24]|uniref:SIS domain-containing protein n=1 Tax=Pantoea sp. NSTU24 TaxID=3391144 RepID=UPI003D044BA9